MFLKLLRIQSQINALVAAAHGVAAIESQLHRYHQPDQTNETDSEPAEIREREASDGDQQQATE